MSTRASWQRIFQKVVIRVFNSSKAHIMKILKKRNS